MCVFGGRPCHKQSTGMHCSLVPVVTASGFLFFSWPLATRPFPHRLLLIPRFPPRRLSLRPRRTCPPRRHASSTHLDAMARKPKTSSPSCDSVANALAAIVWKYTKSMNMRDLARDDDYLSHLFIEKIGSLVSGHPMLVHRMDPRRRLPKTEVAGILAIIHRVCIPRLLQSSIAHRKATRLIAVNRCEAVQSSSNKAGG